MQLCFLWKLQGPVQPGISLLNATQYTGVGSRKHQGHRRLPDDEVTAGHGKDDWTRLQTQLSGLGYRINDPAGSYGRSTLAAVRDFQRHRGLLIDGVFGPDTAWELRRVIALIN